MATGTTALTSNSTESAKHISPIERNGDVWEIVFVHTFASGEADATTFTVPINGILRHITTVTSGASGAVVTATTTINDNADQAIFTDTGIAESTTTNYSVDEPLSGDIDFVVTPSTDPLSAYSVTWTLRGI